MVASATHCSTLQHAAPHGTTLQRTSALKSAKVDGIIVASATHYITAQHITFQHIATHQCSEI